MAAVGGRGLATVHKRGEELSSQRQSFNGLRKFTPEFRWDGSKPPNENSLSLRILGDDIMINTQMHRFVPLPPTETNKTPYFNGVCRKAFPIGAETCYVCDVLFNEFDGDAKQKKRAGLVPTDVAVALAVEMEAIGRGRSFSGYKVKMTEFEIPQVSDSEKENEEAKAYRALLDTLGKPGDKVQVPSIGLMIGTMSGKQALFDYALKRPTISDRVFEISRYGKGLETSWDWNHDGADRDNPDPAPLLAEFQAKYPIFELPEEWAERNGSEGRYNYFFKLGPSSGDGEAAASAEDKEAEPVPVSDSRAALMDRIKGKGAAK